MERNRDDTQCEYRFSNGARCGIWNMGDDNKHALHLAEATKANAMLVVETFKVEEEEE